ncbi:flagellar export chaperone FliS [Sutcliffiella horikoshii]|uniref:Flagellar secretion chaperone FliS n=1 Tax=Sutcliffiella horikoshii TaxID=79883 RepID=A0A5D4T4Q5_9BACI|nr:flagellar export chaperone FliS [Sutcliffiella horikoshii]TYS69891.1 flagellar export chaperone FliS [Sutcliffiella horikoshii]
MAMKNPYQAYQQNSVNTATPGELTLMLYNGAIKFMKLAKKGMEDKDIEMKNTNLIKAQKIVQELMVTLDTSHDVGKSMMTMYDYMNRRLIDANLKNDSSIVDEVEGHMMEFRDAWKQVIQSSRQQAFAQGGQA